MIFENALDRLEKVGAQGQGVPDLLLPLPKEFGQLFVPHTFSQSCHRAGKLKPTQNEWHQRRQLSVFSEGQICSK